MRLMTLPTDSQARKEIPIFGGCIKYFAAALAGVARWSKLGNDKHNPGEPLHHSRGKSMDHDECIIRHSMDLADLQAAYDRHPDFATMTPLWTTEKHDLIQAMLDELDARAWRALAASQEFREKHGLAPLAPGARLPGAPTPHGMTYCFPADGDTGVFFNENGQVVVAGGKVQPAPFHLAAEGIARLDTSAKAAAPAYSFLNVDGKEEWPDALRMTLSGAPRQVDVHESAIDTARETAENESRSINAMHRRVAETDADGGAVLRVHLESAKRIFAGPFDPSA